jgi:acetate kinase
MCGVDAIVFAGGIGENSVALRAAVLPQLGWLGVQLDPVANQGNGSRITVADSTVSAWVVHTDEEAVVARHVARTLGGPRDGAS